MKSKDCQSVLNTREVRLAIKYIYLFYTELVSFDKSGCSMTSITALKKTKYSGIWMIWSI